MHFARCSFPDDVFGSDPGTHEHHVAGGRPHTSSVRWCTSARTRSSSIAVDAHLGDDHDALLALVALDAEGDHVAGADALDGRDRTLDVLREDVAATDDDHVLEPAAQDELAVEQVGQVAGAQPAVVEQRGGGVRRR